MRWNCPHCGTALAVSDDRIAPRWMVASCHACGGYSMVRPASPRSATPNTPRVIPAGMARSRGPSRGRAEPALPAAPLPSPLPETPDGSHWKRNLVAGAIALVVTSVIAGSSPVRSRATDPSRLIIQRLDPPERKVAEAPLGADEIHQRAMAPERVAPEEILKVRISVEDANLRSGPGLDSPVVGLGDPTVTYRITQWQGRWFEVVPEQAATLGVNGPAWIRNDLLEPATNE